MIDSALYSEASRVGLDSFQDVISRCHFCLADSHDTRESVPLDLRRGTHQSGLHTLLHTLLRTHLHGSKDLCKFANCLTNQEVMLVDICLNILLLLPDVWCASCVGELIFMGSVVWTSWWRTSRSSGPPPWSKYTQKLN